MDATSPSPVHESEHLPARRRAPLARRFWRLSPSGDAIVEAPYAVDAVRQRERLYRWALVATDMAAILGVILTAVVFGGATPQPAVLLALPLIVIVSKAYGLYERDELLLNKTTIDEAPQLFQVSTLLALAFSLVDERVLDLAFAPAAIVSLWFVLFSYVLLGRRFTRSVLKRAVPVERCVLVGDEAAFGRLDAKLGAAKAELVGRMSPPPSTQRDVGAHERALHDLLDRTQAHRVVIDPQALPDREMLALVRTAKGLGVRVSLLPSVHDVVGSEVVFDDLQGMTLLGVRRFGLSRSSRMLKRSFDLVGGSLMLLGAAPLMIAIAVAIKLDSRGPVFFRQTRVGRAGRHFRIYKFRSMVVNAEARKAELENRNEAADGLFKIADDPRITRVGRILRKTSLDELAQLLNVLRGDMSLVGPRPLVLDEDRLISGADRSRLQLTPGMTGHWQIAGSSRIPMHEMVKIDYLYVAGWSLWADVKILLRTVPYMLARRGM